METAQEIIKNKSLAIIDDDDSILNLTQFYFQKKGYHVTIYSDAESVFKEICQQNRKFDLILSDFYLPKMSGFEMASSLHKMGNTTPIIIMTGTKNLPHSENEPNIIKDCVQKPLRLMELAEKIEKTISPQAMENDIIAHSAEFLGCLKKAEKTSQCKSHILLYGESGTGKEVLANYIHQLSPFRQGPFVAINCSAIPENLLEAELFGYAKGSFTGAVEKRIGLFESANNGTLFLDEIADLPLGLQAKILRVLQEKKIKRVGENHDRDINCRVISASHKKLSHLVNKGLFREDLFYRLNVIEIEIPALRDRKKDILPLANFFLKKHSTINNKYFSGFSQSAQDWMLENKWRGNVRELENQIEKAVVLEDGPWLFLSEAESPFANSLLKNEGDFTTDIFSQEKKVIPIDLLVQKYILHALKVNKGLKSKTAIDLGIDRKTLHRKLKEIPMNEFMSVETE